MREIGIVKQVQIQRSALKRGENPTRIYDPAPLLVVDGLTLSPQGVVGLMMDGTQMVDVHNANHPDSKNQGGINGVSVGFTSHYTEMRAKFGVHLADGIAGENILIETNAVVKLTDLGKRLAFQNPATGVVVYLVRLVVAAPCEPFSRFALQQMPPVKAETMKAALQFLDAGIRGFYATASGGTIMAGDKAFADDEER